MWPFGRKIGDDNALLDDEINVLKQVVAQWHPNAHFAGLQRQLLEWLRVRKVGVIAPAPDWFSRKVKGDRRVLAQQRMVGSNFLLPAALGTFSIAFPCRPGSEVTFEIRELVQKVVFPSPLADLTLLAPQLDDDRPYWESARTAISDLGGAIDATLAVLEARAPRPRDPYVMMARPMPAAKNTIGGIVIPPAYARLLGVTSGICTKRAAIWGGEELGQRVETIENQRWLYAGRSSTGFFLLRIAGDRAEDTVHVWSPRGGVRRAADDVIALAASLAEKERSARNDK